MSRPLFVALIVGFVGIQCLSADEPAALRPSQRKVAIEKMLDAPLNWEPGDRKHVTLAELIEYVREEHHLQIRWDVSSLGWVSGDQAPLWGLVPTSLARQTDCPVPCPTVTATTPVKSLPNSYPPGQTQPEPFNPYAAASKPAVAETTFGSSPRLRRPVSNTSVSDPGGQQSSHRPGNRRALEGRTCS